MDLSRDELCLLIDKLTIQSLDLIEEQVRQKLVIEKYMKNGESLIAKTRYQQGTQSVSALQLPTEDSKDFYALVTVSRDEHDEVTAEEHKTDKEAGFVDPLKWFGYLSPRSLSFAATNFRKATLASIECANVQRRLGVTLETLERLHDLKDEMGIENVK